jgi:hypothetical protein
MINPGILIDALCDQATIIFHLSKKLSKTKESATDEAELEKRMKMIVRKTVAQAEPVSPGQQD